MPEVMLRRDWPGTFHRTVKISERRKELLEFSPGVPVELNAKQLEGVRSDLGVALMPVERDEKNKPRIITDDVDAEPEETNAENAG